MNIEPNKYAGKCVRCGGRVAEGAGSFRFIKPSEQDWPHTRGLNFRDIPVLEHLECMRKYDGTDVHFKHHPDPECEVLGDG